MRASGVAGRMNTPARPALRPPAGDVARGPRRRGLVRPPADARPKQCGHAPPHHAHRADAAGLYGKHSPRQLPCGRRDAATQVQTSARFASPFRERDGMRSAPRGSSSTPLRPTQGPALPATASNVWTSPPRRQKYRRSCKHSWRVLASSATPAGRHSPRDHHAALHRQQRGKGKAPPKWTASGKGLWVNTRVRAVRHGGAVAHHRRGRVNNRTAARFQQQRGGERGLDAMQASDRQRLRLLRARRGAARRRRGRKGANANALTTDTWGRAVNRHRGERKMNFFGMVFCRKYAGGCRRSGAISMPVTTRRRGSGWTR